MSIDLETGLETERRQDAPSEIGPLSKQNGKYSVKTNVVLEVMNLAKEYFRSAVMSVRNGDLFRNIDCHCLFVGYPKSGHSLIGSLLDAHPNMIMAHELGVLKYVLAGFSMKQIDSLLLENSRLHGFKGRRERDYIYNVPNQWQGRFENLTVIGDKHGEGVSLRLGARPWLLTRLEGRLGRVKFIHVIRNPYDVITSLTLPASRQLYLPGAVDYFFKLCDTVMMCKKRIASDRFYELRFEDFVADPVVGLRQLCLYLGLNTTAEYLSACVGILFKSPNRTRHKKKWSPELIDSVKKRMERIPFLNGYSPDLA